MNSIGFLVILASFEGCTLLLAQSDAVTATVEANIREQALATEPHPQWQFVSSLVLTYIPSNHPDLRVAAYYSRGPKSEIELVEETVPMPDVIRLLRNSSEPINIDLAVRMMKIRKSHFEVDSSVMKKWLHRFRTVARNAIDQVAVPGPVYLDGTVYQARYRGSIDVQIDVSGGEIGETRGPDPEFIRWMNAFLVEVRELQKSRH